MSLEIIKKYKILAKKSLGQNFLIDEDILESIAGIIDISWKHIIEVGPGYWALTEFLLHAKPSSLYLVELDRDMISILEDRVVTHELNTQDVDFHIHNIDVLKFTPEMNSYSVIANIPYYITSPILRHFIYGVENSPENMIILMQKDVGDKIIGGKKDKTSVIRLLVEKRYKVSEKLFVPPESFSPSPKIDSSVLLFKKHNNFQDIDDDKFLEIIKIWFSSNRKKLIKNLVAGWYEKEKIIWFFQENDILEMVRWEDLSIDIWVRLVSYLIEVKK